MFSPRSLSLSLSVDLSLSHTHTPFLGRSLSLSLFPTLRFCLVFPLSPSLSLSGSISRFGSAILVPPAPTSVVECESIVEHAPYSPRERFPGAPILSPAAAGLYGDHVLTTDSRRYFSLYASMSAILSRGAELRSGAAGLHGGHVLTAGHGDVLVAHDIDIARPPPPPEPRCGAAWRPCFDFDS